MLKSKLVTLRFLLASLSVVALVGCGSSDSSPSGGNTETPGTPDGDGTEGDGTEGDETGGSTTTEGGIKDDAARAAIRASIHDFMPMQLGADRVTTSGSANVFTWDNTGEKKSTDFHPATIVKGTSAKLTMPSTIINADSSNIVRLTLKSNVDNDTYNILSGGNFTKLANHADEKATIKTANLNTYFLANHGVLEVDSVTTDFAMGHFTKSVDGKLVTSQKTLSNYGLTNDSRDAIMKEDAKLTELSKKFGNAHYGVLVEGKDSTNLKEWEIDSGGTQLDLFLAGDGKVEKLTVKAANTTLHMSTNETTEVTDLNLTADTTFALYGPVNEDDANNPIMALQQISGDEKIKVDIRELGFGQEMVFVATNQNNMQTFYDSKFDKTVGSSNLSPKESNAAVTMEHKDKNVVIKRGTAPQSHKVAPLENASTLLDDTRVGARTVGFSTDQYNAMLREASLGYNFAKDVAMSQALVKATAAAGNMSTSFSVAKDADYTGNALNTAALKAGQGYVVAAHAAPESTSLNLKTNQFVLGYAQHVNGGVGSFAVSYNLAKQADKGNFKNHALQVLNYSDIAFNTMRVEGAYTKALSDNFNLSGMVSADLFGNASYTANIAERDGSTTKKDGSETLDRELSLGLFGSYANRAVSVDFGAQAATSATVPFKGMATLRMNFSF